MPTPGTGRRHRLLAVGAANGRLACLRQTEVSHLAFRDQFLDRPGDVLDGYSRIDPVLAEQIDVIRTQPPQGSLDDLADMLGPAGRGP